MRGGVCKLVNFANHLDELLTEVLRATGPLKQNALQAVRDYVKTLTDADFSKQISQITSIDELRVLQAAGVRISVYRTYLKQYELISQYAGSRLFPVV